jgi:hypothetical protein
MKDILFIGGPKTVQGVDRVDDDVVSIIEAEGVFDRKAVVVWPTEDFLTLPSDPAKLRSVVDMTRVEEIAMEEKGLLPKEGIPVAEAEPLRVVVREDQEAMDKALINWALTQAFTRLSVPSFI